MLGLAGGGPYMLVTDLPASSTHAAHDEAITLYAAMVRSRAIAVYRLGSPWNPGLSDVDLLVVTDRSAMDNRHFFSAIGRMPERFHPLFLHEPYILPAWSLRVMRYTSHYGPALLCGRDVLHAYAPDDDADERWCRLLEAYCSFAAFAISARERGALSGAQTMSIATSFLPVLRDARSVLQLDECGAYEKAIDGLAARFFQTGDPATNVLEGWSIFSSAFDRLDAALCGALGAGGTAGTIARAQLDFERRNR